MKFCWCTILVKNMEESLKFYQEVLGLKLERRFASSQGSDMAFLGEGETKVELICNKNKEIHYSKDFSLGFEISSVDGMLHTLQQKGIQIESGPFQPAPMVKFFYIYWTQMG